jgi:hypothetical protein
MSDAIFIANKASGILKIGDKREIDRALWRKPHDIRWHAGNARAEIGSLRPPRKLLLANLPIRPQAEIRQSWSKVQYLLEYFLFIHRT